MAWLGTRSGSGKVVTTAGRTVGVGYRFRVHSHGDLINAFGSLSSGDLMDLALTSDFVGTLHLDDGSTADIVVTKIMEDGAFFLINGPIPGF